MRFFIPIILFLLIACDDIDNHEKLGSLTIVFNTSLIDPQSSSSSNRLEKSESIASISLAVIKIGDNSPVNIDLTDLIPFGYGGLQHNAGQLPAGPIQVTVELYSKGVLNIDELRFSQTKTVVIEGGIQVTAQFNDWIPNLSNMYFYHSFEESESIDYWLTGNDNPFFIDNINGYHGSSSALSGSMNNGSSFLRTDDDVWFKNLPSTSPQDISIVYYAKAIGDDGFSCDLDIVLGLRINNGNSSPVELDTYRVNQTGQDGSNWTRSEVKFSPNAIGNITGFYFDILPVTMNRNCKCSIDYIHVY